jgi:hypothetical protein
MSQVPGINLVGKPVGSTRIESIKHELPNSSQPQSNLGAVIANAMDPVVNAANDAVAPHGVTQFHVEEAKAYESLWGDNRRSSILEMFDNNGKAVEAARGTPKAWGVMANENNSAAPKAASSDATNSVGGMTPEQVLKLIAAILKALGVTPSALAEAAKGSSAGNGIEELIRAVIERLSGRADSPSGAVEVEVEGKPVKPDAIQKSGETGNRAEAQPAKTETAEGVSKAPKDHVVIQLSELDESDLKNGAGVKFINSKGIEFATIQRGVKTESKQAA